MLDNIESPPLATATERDDILWRQLKSLPAFRALLRAVESRFYHQIELPEPILDLGCGDGDFAQLTFDQPLSAGIDPWWGPLLDAKKTDAYHILTQSMGNLLPFPDNSFNSVISNSVLEHIPSIQPVLNDAGRVLKTGGKLMITMPSHHFTENLGGAQFFAGMGLNGMANRYRKLFNRISRHAHTDSVEVWGERLGQAGFAVERWQYYFSQQALHALEWGHLQGLPSWIAHLLTGHWILAPWRESLRRTEAWVRPFFEEEAPPDGAYLLIIARKVADAPVSVQLPPPQPFSLAELQAGEEEQQGVDDSFLPNRQSVISSQLASEQLISEQPSPIPTRLPAPTGGGTVQGKKLLTGLLIALILAFGALGQSLLSAESPGSGGLWAWGFALLMMGALGLYSQGAEGMPALPTFSLSLPNWRNITPRRWLILPALFLSLISPSFATIHPIISLFSWFLAGGMGFFALHREGETLGLATKLRRLTAWESGGLALLFFIGLMIRLVALESHPFILNGTEANIGLDAGRIARGEIINPFGASWLSNPTLSLMLHGLPLRFLGQTKLAVRLMSPIAGILGIVAIYIVGRRLWGQAVGLASAILLAGSHVHLHYSRVGMSNIWEPLVATLAFGTLSLAWQSGGRLRWLIAGIALGITPYFYTTAHLFPLMLGAFGLWALFTDRSAIQQHGSHLVAGILLALVLATPQLNFYQANMSLFMERGRVLSASDWVAREVVQTGESSQTLWREQIWRGGLAFNSVPDVSLAYKSERAMVSYLPALLLLLGIGLSAWGWRRAEQIGLLIWLGVTLIFAGILLIETPSSHRLLIGLPAVCLLVGQALAWLGTRLKDGFGWRKGGVIAGILIIATLISIWETAFYFGDYRTSYRFGDRNSEIADGVGHYLADLTATDEGDWLLYFHGAPSMFTTFPTIAYLADGRMRHQNMIDVLASELPALPDQPYNISFIFVPERSGERQMVKEAYPGGTEREIAGNFANPLFFVYELRR